MQTRSMPGGKPKWHGNNLEDRKLSDLFGFIEAYVVCPNTLKKPFREKKEHSHLSNRGISGCLLKLRVFSMHVTRVKRFYHGWRLRKSDVLSTCVICLQEKTRS